MISEKLIDRLKYKTAQQLSEKVRVGRRHALSSISRCCVVLTDDGRDTREVIFDEPSTIGQLAARVGPDEWVVSIKMRRVPRRARAAMVLAAE